jgi:hypothetical protein
MRKSEPVEQLLATATPEMLRAAVAALPARRPGVKPIGATAGVPVSFRSTVEFGKRLQVAAKAAGFGGASAFIRDTLESPRWFPAKPNREDSGGPHRVTFRAPEDARARWEHLAAERGFAELSAFVRAALEIRLSS